MVNNMVGGITTPLKNMKIKWEYYSQYMENKKCSKPNHQPVTIEYERAA